jgi:hypothetical protein
VTETLKIEARDRVRGCSALAKIRPQRHAILAVFLAYLSVCICLRAQPITGSYAETEVPVAGTNSQSGPASAGSTNNMDYNGLTILWVDRSQAHTTFGLNSAYADSMFTYSDFPEGNPAASNAAAIATASYILSWSTLDHSSSGNILSLSLSGNGSVSGLHLGLFQFHYGTPYIIQSSLSLYANYTGYYSANHAVANSVWSDTFTIHGQPDGVFGLAGFGLDLNGSISSSSVEGPPLPGSAPTTPTRIDLVTANFTNGASLDYVFLPDGATLATDPDFPAIVTTPEPSAAALVLFCGTALVLHRRCQRRQGC